MGRCSRGLCLAQLCTKIKEAASLKVKGSLYSCLLIACLPSGSRTLNWHLESIYNGHSPNQRCSTKTIVSAGNFPHDLIVVLLQSYEKPSIDAVNGTNDGGLEYKKEFSCRGRETLGINSPQRQLTVLSVCGSFNFHFRCSSVQEQLQQFYSN